MYVCTYQTFAKAGLVSIFHVFFTEIENASCRFLAFFEAVLAAAAYDGSRGMIELLVLAFYESRQEQMVFAS